MLPQVSIHFFLAPQCPLCQWLSPRHQLNKLVRCIILINSSWLIWVSPSLSASWIISCNSLSFSFTPDIRDTCFRLSRLILPDWSVARRERSCETTIVARGNLELYDPTDMSELTVGQLTADSRATNGRQFYKVCRPTVTQLSEKCWFSVGQLSVMCRDTCSSMYKS